MIGRSIVAASSFLVLGAGLLLASPAPAQPLPSSRTDIPYTYAPLVKQVSPAVVNAVMDALSPLGIRHVDMPLTPQTVWRAMRDARGRGNGTEVRS